MPGSVVIVVEVVVIVVVIVEVRVEVRVSSVECRMSSGGSRE